MVEKMMKVVIAAGMAAGVLAVGCLTRPVVNEDPTTKTSFAATVKQQSIDKVDLLFAIDNSASMGDKQDLLAAAVPVLVNRLLQPNCVDTNTANTCKVAGDCTALGANAQCDPAGNTGNGQCFLPGDGKDCATLTGTKAEFPAVHDMHVGIVSSALGGGGSPDICANEADTTFTGAHQNDKGHLLNRTGVAPSEGVINNAKPTDGNGGGFLAWLPASDSKNQGKTPPNVTPYSDGQASQLVQDFQSLVAGVQQHGCGLEAQLESWYHFLIQPDPWDTIPPVSGTVAAQLQGVDATLLKMRHDFLRPDSLVAIIQLTDEEDSWSDPLWEGGFGWAPRTLNFPGGPGGSTGVGPRGTSECDEAVNPNDPTNTGPNNPDCVSCAFGTNNKPKAGTPISADPNCNACAPNAPSGCTKGWWSPATTSTNITAADGVNVRYGNQYMRSRYGFDSEHNIQRYVDGLRSPTVPDRDHEAHDYQNYGATVRNCINPLFAGDLPDGSDTSTGAICTGLKAGSRTPDLVFYALIGGVPNSLVEDANGKFKIDLGADDWVKILGKDPSTYQLDGIDPHMIESTAPRNTLPPPGTTYNLGSDPDNGREWNTLTSGAEIDLQYACTFDLPQPKDCTLPANANACDCTGTASSAPDGPPLCSTATRTTQIKGKAYPTIRELRVAKGLGAQSVVASLCAQKVTGSTSDPAYGYNPAMQAIVNRLKNALSGQCLPEALTVGLSGVPCLILVEYPLQTDQNGGCTDPGMCNPANPSTCGCTSGDTACAATYTGILQRFQQQFQASLGDSGAAQPTPVACVFKQLTQSASCTGTDCYSGNTCEGSPNIGWCYVSGAANTGGCPQAIKFGGSGPPGGTTIDLQCIEQTGGGGGNGG